MKYRNRLPWRQAEPWKDDTALTARELLPALIVWFLLLGMLFWILPIWLAAEVAR